MKHIKLLSLLKKVLTIVLAAILITACSPHPGAGKWQAIDDNSLGIKKLSILFEGKSEFTTIENEKVKWHCFWGAESKTKMSMTCTPSIDTNEHETFAFIMLSEDEGQFSRNGKAIGNFSRLPYE
jgi:hypothetical protein